jgi:hypothetical protein
MIVTHLRFTQQQKHGPLSCLPSKNMPEDSQSMQVTPANLPQPTETGRSSYRYRKFDQIDEFLPDGRCQPDALCWVLTSKGKQKTPQLYERARVLSICDEDKDRITVQYPKGSTYRVRRSNLMPVLENETNLILVASETNDYRRTATVQTRKEDHFIEIGCDFGILVDSVDAASTLGVDKSEESIRIARERYPTHEFLLGDVFEKLDVAPQHPLVVAIDINGNRELPAVLKCIQLALDKWSPRLLVVKSRELYTVMNNGKEENDNSLEPK